MLRAANRSATFWGFTILSLLPAGCDQTKPVAPPPAVAPAPGPTIPGPPSSTIPGPPPANPTPSQPPIPAPAQGSTTSGAAGLTLEIAGDARAARARELVAELATIKDDATATAAAARLPALAQNYGVKQFNATMAALSLAGQDEQIRKYLEQRAATASPEEDLVNKIEAAVSGPQGPIVQPAINGLLDVWMQNATTGERRALERLIEKKQLRR